MASGRQELGMFGSRGVPKVSVGGQNYHVVTSSEAIDPGVFDGIPADLASQGARVAAAEESLSLFTGPSMLVVPIGDSTIAASSDLNYWTATDWFVRLISLSGGKLMPWGWAATGGHSLADSLARIPADVLALNPRPRYAVVLGGINDIGAAATASEVISRLTAIYDALVAGGVCPIPVTILPSDGQSAATIATVNQWITANASSMGWPFADAHSAVVDPTNGHYASGMSGDGTHPNAAGNAAIAAYVWPQISSLFTSPPFLASSAVDGASLLKNGLFIGDANSDGYADNWSENGGGGTAVVSLVAGDAPVLGNWQQYAISGTAAARELVNASANAGFTEGDLLEFSGRYEVDAPSAGSHMSIQLKTQDAVTFMSPVIDANFAQESGIFRIRGVVPAGTTMIYPSITGITPASGSITCRVAQMTITNLTALGLS